LLEAERTYGSGVHHLVFRTSNSEYPDTFDGKRCTNAVLAWPLLDAVIVLPDAAATRAAAEGILPAPLHVLQPVTGNANEVTLSDHCHLR